MCCFYGVQKNTCIEEIGVIPEYQRIQLVYTDLWSVFCPTNKDKNYLLPVQDIPMEALQKTTERRRVHQSRLRGMIPQTTR